MRLLYIREGRRLHNANRYHLGREATEVCNHRRFPQKPRYPQVADINERCGGKLPIVVLDKDIDQRMASTVRHNRARGSHSVDGMVNIVFNMLRDGVSEREICEKVGLEQKELVV